MYHNRNYGYNNSYSGFNIYNRTEKGYIPSTETEYKGIKFRSKMEAYWASYWDCLGIKWDYEPAAFDVQTSKLDFGDYKGTYLPDFFLENAHGYYTDSPGLWVEVKNPAAYAKETRDIVGKVEGLIKNTGYPLLILPGSPWNIIELYSHYKNRFEPLPIDGWQTSCDYFDISHYSGRVTLHKDFLFYKCANCKTVSVTHHLYQKDCDDRDWLIRENENWNGSFHTEGCINSEEKEYKYQKSLKILTSKLEGITKQMARNSL